MVFSKFILRNNGLIIVFYFSVIIESFYKFLLLIYFEFSINYLIYVIIKYIFSNDCLFD